MRRRQSGAGEGVGRWLTGKRCEECFMRCLNVCSVLDSRTQVGSLFQTVGAAKLKARLLKFVVWGGFLGHLFTTDEVGTLMSTVSLNVCAILAPVPIGQLNFMKHLWSNKPVIVLFATVPSPYKPSRANQLVTSGGGIRANSRHACMESESTRTPAGIRVFSTDHFYESTAADSLLLKSC